MKITVFSDIHGNLPALEQLFQLEQDADLYLFLGDAVNYGPWSNECVQLLANLKNGLCIRGNHEDYFLQGYYHGTNPLVHSFFEKAYHGFSEFKTIEKYLTEIQLFGFQIQHTIEHKNIYPDTPLSINANFFIGHSHYQFATESNGFQLFNPGSIGQNRRFINLINYINWFPQTQEVQMKQALYPVDKLFQEMQNRHYPTNCINYYRQKPFY
jgi:putative phosphoesterase